jgi:SulP family sulfate permease
MPMPEKKVHLRHLSKDCAALLKKASAIIDVNYFKDPSYKVVTDTEI